MTNTKMIILCGGRGKRMGSFTTNIPKPMIKIGGKPIIEHKIKYYQSRGIDKFIFCLGYKANILKKFLIKKTNKSIFNNGGIKTGILKRIYLAKHNITSDTLISYGDTLAKINFKDLISKHKKSKCMITIVVAPIQNPFGLVNWNAKGRATKFDEKPILNHFIGYAVLSPNFFKNISKKIINLSDGKGVVQAINYLIKKKKLIYTNLMIYKLQLIHPQNLKMQKLIMINILL